MKDHVLKLLQDRYFLRTEKNWNDIAHRVSGICSGDLQRQVYELINEMKFIPSTPTLMNANTDGARVGGLSSCFPMGIEDSIDGIFDSLKDAAVVTKYAGGVGYDFSKLRSSKEVVNTLDGRTSTGPLPFMDMFNSMLDGIRQGGARRGAGMAMLNIDHPDILDFIKSKEFWETQRLARFNISVKVTNEFYEKLETEPDSPMIVRNVTDRKEHILKDEMGNTVSYKQLWDLIVSFAHKSAEPGIFNIDTAFDQCSVTNYSKDVLSNPCSEFTNIAYSSCNLGSLNLTKYLTEENEINWKQLKKDTQIATRFLDSVIDVNLFPVGKIEKVTKDIRPIGLGVMGLAHMFMKMQIPFASKEASEITKKIIAYITLVSMETSVDLAKETAPYNAFDLQTFLNANKRFFYKDVPTVNGYIEDIEPDHIRNRVIKNGVRNSCFTSIAPTGTISFISDVSGGIEPVFALAYVRKIEVGKNSKNEIVYEEVYIADRFFEEYIDTNEHLKSKKSEILKYVANNNGSCQGCEFLTKNEQEIFKTAQDLTATEHLDILESVAKMTSLSVSKTINLTKDATEQDVADVYLDANKRGIIGVTVYRDGSRGGVLVQANENKDRNSEIIKTHAPKRPESLDAAVDFVTYNKKEYYVAVGFLKNDVYEIYTGENIDEKTNTANITIKSGKIVKKNRGNYILFSNEGKSHYNLTSKNSDSDVDALTRSISTSLRHGVDISIIVTQLEKTKGSLNSFAKVLARVLKTYVNDGTEVFGEECEHCGGKLVRKEGCKVCENPECGNSICG